MTVPPPTSTTSAATSPAPRTRTVPPPPDRTTPWAACSHRRPSEVHQHHINIRWGHTFLLRSSLRIFVCGTNGAKWAHTVLLSSCFCRCAPIAVASVPQDWGRNARRRLSKVRARVKPPDERARSPWTLGRMLMAGGPGVSAGMSKHGAWKHGPHLDRGGGRQPGGSANAGQSTRHPSVAARPGPRPACARIVESAWTRSLRS